MELFPEIEQSSLFFETLARRQGFRAVAGIDEAGRGPRRALWATMMGSMQTTDLLVVGAGPAGLAVAISATEAGLSCEVVEKGVLVRGGKPRARTYNKGRGKSGPPPAPSDEARAAVLKKLTTAGADGLPRKDLAGETGDAATLDAILVEPEIEEFQRPAPGESADGNQADGETRYRIKEGSLGQRPLFESAAPPPPHAND